MSCPLNAAAAAVVTAVSVGGPKVYDVTKYLSDHPGGPEIMLDLAGR